MTKLPVQDAPRARHIGVGVLVGTAVVVTALNLRPAVVGVSPLLPRIRADLTMSAPVAGLISTASIVFFGLMAPVAPRLARRFGLEASVVGGLALLAVGIGVRLLPQAGWLFVGAVLAGTGIAVCNTLIPAIVKRDFPHRLGSMTGLYSGTLSLGAGLAAALAVPVADAVGSWRSSLAIWLVPAVVALAGWLGLRRHWTAPVVPEPDAPPTVSLLRQPLAWWVTIYLAAQSFEFYAAAAWIPTLFGDAGVSKTEAGLLLGYANVIGVVAAVVGPTFAGRRRSQAGSIVVVVAIYLVGLAGLAFAPAAAPWLWMSLFGIAQGAGFALGLLLVAVRAPDVAIATRLSGMSQFVAYAVAATGPFLYGLVHDATGGWAWPIGVGMAMLVVMLVTGVLAGRDRVVAGG
ncbi:MFS transporter [Jatrophihabitans sp. YIM 134969]